MTRPFFVALTIALAACAHAPSAATGEPDRPGQEPCDPVACGKEPVATRWLCKDGGFAGSSGRCLRDAGGTCRWDVRECAELVYCGGVSGIPCPDGSQCLDDPHDDCDPSEQRSGCGGLCAAR